MDSHPNDLAFNILVNGDISNRLIRFFCSRSFYQILYKLYTIYSPLFVFITDYKLNLSKKRCVICNFIEI